MRSGVCWSAAVLTLLALASALRTPQVEGASRVGRRLSAPSAPDVRALDTSDQTKDVQPTFRPRSSRGQEDVPREITRSRTKTRPLERTEAASETERTQPQAQRNDQFDSRRTYSRTRSKPIENEAQQDIPGNRETVIRSRIRQSRRRPTQSLLEVTSPTIDESKIEVNESNLDEIQKVAVRQDEATTTQFRRRSSTSPTTESITPRKLRGRINTRTSSKSLDLAVSGTSNSLSISSKEPTTARTSEDLRNSRKLRYKTRLAETDTNLTGEGIIVPKEVTKSSQIKENITSQPEIKTSDPIVVEITVQPSTETSPVNSTTTKVKKILKRPLVRGKVNFRPSVSLPKVTKTSDEISEDDNYPESFKALLQTKNASTQVNSPNSESFSVKASQKVYKTYTSSAQSTNTAPAKNKYSRFRSKLHAEEGPKSDDKEDIKSTEPSLIPEQLKARTPEYKPRGIYTPRNRKVSAITSSTTTASVSTSRSTERSLYKFSRKFKVTTESPSTVSTIKSGRIETSNLIKKSLIRPTYYSRNANKNSSSDSQAIVGDGIIKSNNSSSVTNRSLPKTSYYSRFRNKTKDDVYLKTEVDSEKVPAQAKSEDSKNMPLIFNLLKTTTDSDNFNEESQPEVDEVKKEKEMFIIAVSSKESLENSTENEVINNGENAENNFIFNTISTTPKYHANYKGQTSVNLTEIKEQVTLASTPPIRNLQTRKYGRQRTKSNELNEEVPSVTPRSRERNLRKYSDSFSKTTEPTTNGITAELERNKNTRFSSKYRGSYLDKPIYKPTVPTITPSTAWLKFFVTDHQLAKYIEEPNWFDEDIYITTEMSRQNFTAPSIMHESSLELVEGEEFQLGPDMNAISFTQTRSTLSSADLRVSESLVKPLHIMNVEASQHSPSVTVSIFEALAEILTSTPRIPRLSSTTEVTQKQITNNDINLSLIGVSNNINVNNVRGLASQDTFTPTNAGGNTKTVQTTDQTTTNVINRLSVGASATTSLNTQEGIVTAVNTPIAPTPPPTTPISARKPFAIKLLYSDTEPQNDKLSTATEQTSLHPSTDSSSTVYNSLSNILLSNNNLLSSELTSMLSNNIRDILKNMDESSRSKISGDMTKLLRNLIPRALNRLTTDDVAIFPETTPYSLEDIRDTENINVDNIIADSKINSIDVLQNVAIERNVNSVTTTRIKENPVPAVNSSDNTPGTTSSTVTVSSGQTTSIPIIKTQGTNVNQSSTSATSPHTTPSTNSLTSSVFLDTESVDIDSAINNRLNNVLSNSTNPNVPLPFFTNAKIKFFTLNESDSLDNNQTKTQVEPIFLTTKSVTPSQDFNNIDIQDPSQISPLQLWVLSKKARVLKMIEDLIRQHNDELVTAPPLTDMLINQQNNIPLSNRLTQIINTMSSTTESTDIREDGFSSPMTTPSFSPFPLSTISQSPESDLSSRKISENGLTLTMETTESSNDFTSTTTQIDADIFSRVLFTGIASSATQPSTETAGEMPSTTPIVTTAQVIVEVSNRAQEDFTSANENKESSQPTMQETTETTTTLINTETTQSNIDMSTLTDSDIMTTQADVDNSNGKSTNATKQNISILSNQLSVVNQIPKKDYVIFGILPNNTVVRKDPNDDILETLTEASPYIVYGILPNNTVIRRFPNGTRVPRVMQKIDVLPISPWSLRNPYSPIHNNPAIVRPQSNPIRVSTNIVTSTDTFNNGTEIRLTNGTVNNQQTMIPSSALNIKDSSSFGVRTTTNKSPAEKSTASHVSNLRTTTMLPSVDEILLNSISSAVKEEMILSSMMSSTREPRILTLDIDPETKQVRTEKPSDGNGGTVFKFIPIDEVMVAPQDTNILKVGSTKSPTTSNPGNIHIVTATTITEANTQMPQILTRLAFTDDPTSTVQVTVGTPIETSPYTVFTNSPTTADTTSPLITAMSPTASVMITTLPPTTTTTTEATTTFMTTPAPTTTTTSVPTTTTPTTTTTPVPTTTTPTPSTTTTPVPITTTSAQTTTTISLPTTTDQTTVIPQRTVTSTVTSIEEDQRNQEKLRTTERSPKTLNVFTNVNQIPFDSTTTALPTTRLAPSVIQQSDNDRLLQAILAANNRNPASLSIPNFGGNLRASTGILTTTSRSIEDEIRQFEDDTKLLRALLAATGQNPATLNIPSLDSLNIPKIGTTHIPTTTTRPTTTTAIPTTTVRTQTTTSLINDDIRKFQEDARLLEALLQVTGQNTNSANFPIISGVTSNVRIASNPLTTSIGSNPTTPINLRPVYTSRTTTSRPLTTLPPSTVPVLTTLQPRASSTVTEAVGISTTNPPFKERRGLPTTTARNAQAVTARRVPSSRFTITTETPSTSTFSDQEDLLFLQNLKSVLNTNSNSDDPEAALANRVIALAVERSLNEIQSSQQANDGRTGKFLATTTMNRIFTTTTTTTTTSTTPQPTTTVKDNTPSIEEDLKQFQEDTKLLQALLKATGQDPSKFNIPTLPNLNVSPNIPAKVNDDLNLLSTLLASPSPLNEPFDSLIQKPVKPILPTTVRPYGAKIAVKDDLKNVQDDAKLLQTLVKLQGVQETTTQRSKLTITGQTPDEALQKLIQQAKPAGMVSEATKAPISISTEYGKSNDALLAALLKDQGFGPTTANSLDEQQRLAALLNQVVVTPKTRRTTTQPPPPPPPLAPRRPILDGLAWLWQQWRETGPGPAASRPNRRPAASPSPSVSSSAATSNRVNWFGSGPFVGNADDRPTSNRIPLEPPRAVSDEQTPGRGQLVTAAINVTRAFSQFLGAAIQGAAQTVQSVIRAGQRATNDVYANGSG